MTLLNFVTNKIGCYIFKRNLPMHGAPAAMSYLQTKFEYRIKSQNCHIVIL